VFEDDFLRRLREQAEQFDRLTRAHDFSHHFKSIQTAAEQLRASGLYDASELAVERLKASALFDSLGAASANLHAMIGETSADLAAQRMKELAGYESSAERVAQSMGVYIDASTNAALHLPLRVLHKQLQASALFTEMASLRLQTVDFARVGSLVQSPPLSRARIAPATRRLARKHEALVSSLADEAAAPTFVAELPSIDLFVHSEAVRSVSPHTDETNESKEVERLRQSVADETAEALERGLSALKPAFREQFLGIRQCAVTRGPDWWSQGAASMRKLVKGVLHTVASNELVLPFVTDPETQLDHKGHPTRATKIAWLCQFIPNKEYRAFVRADLTAALALIDLLDAANHKDEFPDFERQYATVALRVEVFVRHLITLAEARRME